MRLAGNAGLKIAKNRLLGTTPSHNFVGLYLRNQGTYRQLLEKNLLNTNTSPTCPRNMVNIGQLAALNPIYTI